MGAIIASGGNVLAGSPHAREAFVTRLSDALRINVGIALLAAVVATATITAATRRGQAPPNRCLARGDRRGSSTARIVHRVRRHAAGPRRPAADSSPAGQPVTSASHGLGSAPAGWRPVPRYSIVGLAAIGVLRQLPHGRPESVTGELVRDESLAAQLPGRFFE
jgi:hypothetical protein